MKTKVEKFMFIAKIARNIACLTAFFALSASAEDPRTLGYAASGTAAALPAAPDMSGAVVNVTAAQAQYVLDGAYGSIDGKTINFTESVADTLVIGRASKYEGSGTLYRHGSHDGEAMSYADFIAYKNQATWTEGCYYERTLANVTFTANTGVIVNFTAEGGAHVYGTESAPVYDYVRDTGTWTFDTNNGFFKRAILKNITFKGLTFTAKTDFNTSEPTTVFDGFTFTGCTFEIGSTAAGNYALRYYDEYNNGNVRNLVVESCTFKNCYQGVYTHHVKGITVKDCAFDTTGHNAIAIQSQGGEKGACDHGAVVITDNTFKNIGDRIIRFNMVGSGTTITIADNTADGNSGKLDSTTGKREIVAAVSLPENVAEMISASNNDWGANAVAEGAFADAKPVAATIGTVSYETLGAAIAAVKDGETVVVNAGEYKLTGSQSLYKGKAFTIKAAEGAKVSFDMSAAVALHGAMITFEGVTFDYKTNKDYRGLQHADTLVYNDCTINGKVFLYAKSEMFNRCVFNQSAVDYNVWTYGAQKVAFNACTFNCAGKSVFVYTEDKNAKTDLTVASCEFKATAEATGKAAIEIDTSLMTDGGASVTIDDQTTATGFATGSNSGSALWNDKKQTKDTNKNVTVTVAGKTVFAPADGSKERPYSREQFGAMTRAEYIAAQSRLGGTLYVSVGDYSYDQYGTLGNGERNDTVGQIPDHSKLNAYGENGYLGEKNDGANGHTVVFVGGTITSGVKGYTSIDNIGTYLLLAVPAYTKVKFEKTTFNNVFSFNYQLYTSPWSQLGRLAFESCTFNGLIVGSIASTELAFDGCTFTDYRNAVSANNSNPTWIRPAYGNWTKDDNEGQGTGFRSLTSISITGNTVTSTRPVKFERIAQWEMETTVTATDNAFDITPQEGDTSPKNVGLYFGANAKFDLVADKNTKSDGTAALYTAAYKAPNGTDYDGLPAGSTVKNAAGEDVTIDDARVWKKADTLTLKTTEEVASVTNAKGVSVAFATLADALAAAKDGETVTLLADVNGGGIVVPANAFPTGLVVDFAAHTYTGAGLPGGISTTESNGFQLLAGNKITFKNGSLVGATATAGEGTDWTGAPAILIQNYCDLTLEKMTVKGGDETCYTLSNNNGDIVIADSTIVAGRGRQGPFAFDVCRFSSYSSVRVTVKGDSVIDGNVEVSGTIGDGQSRQLDIEGGTFKGTFSVANQPANIAISGGTFSSAVLPEYCAEGFIPKANGDGTFGVKEGAYVAAIGDEKYETLAEAIAAAKASKTVMLIADTRENVIIDKRLTLDLNGFTLNGGTVQGKAALTVNAARVTIKDSSEAKTGMIKREDTAANSGTTSYYVLDIQGKGGFVLFEGGTVINDSGTTDGARKGASLVRIGDDGVSAYPQLTIKGGTFTQNNFVAIKVDRGTFYLTGGTINCPNDEAVKNWGAAIIKGGTVNGTVASWVYADSKASSTLTISDDATVNGNVYAMSYDGAEGKTAKVSITGGYVTGELGTYQGKNIHEKTALSDAEKASIGVTGGRFTKDPSAYLAEDSTVIKGEDEIFSVQKAYLAKIGDTYYYTMDDAFHAANASEKIETIVLLRDYTTMALQNSGSKGFTLDLNGKTWTCKGSDANSAAFEINYPNVTLTVKNGKVVSDQLLGLIPSAMGGTITYDNAALVFEDVEATVNGRSGIETNGNNTNNSITLKGCSLTVADGYGIYFPSSGTLTIEDSVIVAKTMGVQVCAGTLSISGASKITVTGDAVAKVGNDGAIEDGAAVSVVNRMGYKALEKIVLAGGTFTAKAGNTALKAYAWANGTESAFDNAMGTIAISGGTFSTAVSSDYCAEGYEPVTNADGTYGVKATFEIVTVKTAVGADTTINVRIPNALMEKVAGATRFEKFTNLSKADANGNLAWVNLVAGIDSTTKVTMTAPQKDDADVIDVDLSAVGTAPAGTDVTVHYEIRAEGSDAAVVSATTAEGLVINLNGKAGISTYRAYVCLQQNGTEVARVASENKLGVLQTVSAAKKTIIAVPWLSLTGLTDGNAIAVADLVKTAGLTAGDKLHVYNKAESRYDVYELAADRAWTPKAIYKVGADGTVEAVSSGTPETTTVARGNGVWLERHDTTKAIVSYGQVASGTVATTIDAGMAENPTWNLLAVPTTTAVDIKTTFGASEADTLIVPMAGAPKICTVKDGAWGYAKSVPVTDASGNKLGVRVERETVTELPAGTGFWYLNGGAAKTVNW